MEVVERLQGTCRLTALTGLKPNRWLDGAPVASDSEVPPGSHVLTHHFTRDVLLVIHGGGDGSSLTSGKRAGKCAPPPTAAGTA